MGIEKREMDEDAHGSLFINIRNEVQRIVEINIKDLKKQWKCKLKVCIAFAALQMNASLHSQRSLGTCYSSSWRGHQLPKGCSIGTTHHGGTDNQQQ